jgi:hypothetical protein
VLVTRAVVEQRRMLHGAIDPLDVDGAHTVRPCMRAVRRKLQRIQRNPRVAAAQRDQPRLRVVGELHLQPPDAALRVGDGAAHQHAQIVVTERFEPHHPRPRQQRRIDLERRVLGGGPEQPHQAALDLRQYRVLLRLVEAVDLVDEQQRPPLHALPLARPLHHLAKIGDARADRAHRLERRARHGGDDARQRGLAAARRPPEDQRRKLIGFQRLAQHRARTDRRLVSDELVQRPRPHPPRQRCARVPRGLRGIDRTVIIRRPAATAAEQSTLRRQDSPASGMPAITERSACAAPRMPAVSIGTTSLLLGLSAKRASVSSWRMATRVGSGAAVLIAV